jgi:spore coat protein H
VVLSIAVLLAACARKEQPLAGSGYLATASDRPQGGPGAGPAFPDDRIHDYAITIDPGVWATLIANATREEYVPAALTAAGVNLGTVGLRFKGSNGTLLTCFQGGKQICPKASFKIKFDHVDPKGRFFGLKRINLNASADDRSAMHERLAFELFQQMGIPAPRSAFARVTLNGEPLGLYVAVEEVDGRFAADRWPQQGDGNIYKEIWPGNAGSADFTPALKTNEDNPNHHAFSVLNNLVKTANPHDLGLILDEWLDVDYLMRYLAIDDAIVNWDGLRSFYCDDSGVYCGNHNYNWYQDETKNHFWVVPWDLSQTFRLYDPFWKIPRWNARDVDCSQRGVTPKGNLLRSGGCDRVLTTLAQIGGSAYDHARSAIAARWDALAPSTTIDRWARLIEPVVLVDGRGPGLAGWRLAIKELKRDLEVIRAGLDSSAEPLSEGAETIDLFRNSFEGAARPAFLARTQFSGSRRSGVMHDLNRDQPLSGTQDVLMQFEFANDIVDGAPVPYTQAALLQLPVKSATSLLQARSIHFQWKTSAARSIIVSISGQHAWRDHLHPRLVAEVQTEPGRTDYTVDIATMTSDTDDAGFDEAARRELLGHPEALLFQIQPVGLVAGLLPAGRTDAGTAQLDNLVIE